MEKKTMRTMRPFAFLIFIATTGCADYGTIGANGGGADMMECTSAADCPSDRPLCHWGRCLPDPGCKSYTDCPPDRPICYGGECIPDPGCKSDQDCPPGDYCLNGGCLPKPSTDGGMCDGPSPSDGGEMSMPDSGGCVSNNECPEGTSCLNGVCVPNPSDGGGGCQSNNECPNGTSCQNGVCVPNPPADMTPPPDMGAPPDMTPPADMTPPPADMIPPPSDGGGGCLSNNDCPEGKVCRNGQCVCDGEDHDQSPCGDGKTLLCHYPPGNPGNKHNICVGNPAVPAHMKHNDTLGACP